MSARNTRAAGAVENGPGAQSGPQDAPEVAASYELYRLLLYICPPRFRQRYGAEMAQVFHDCCREAWGESERRDAHALLALWGHALLDLAVTAISVWRKESISMSGQSGIRVGALAGLVAGAWCSSIFVGIALVTVSGNLSSGLAWLWPVLNGVGTGLITLEVATPVVWALFILGLVVLHFYLDRAYSARASTRGRWLAWSACALTCLGGLLLLASGPFSLYPVSVAWFGNLSYPLDLNGPHVRMAGALVMGVALPITTALALRIKALGRLRWLLMGVSLLALVNASVTLAVLWLAPAPAVMGTTSGHLRYVWFQAALVWNALWGALWIPLGLRLWALAGASSSTMLAPSLTS